MEAEKGDVPSIDRKVEENPFPFELLPLKLKEKILERVIDETSDYYEFKKFWRLKRVNKEFYTILSSEYAKRHFLKYPCSISIHDGNQKIWSGRTLASLKITYPATRRDMSYSKMNDDILNNGVMLVHRCHTLFFDDIPKFLRARPFRIDLTIVDPLYTTDQQLSAIVELANQSSEKTPVVIFTCFHDLGLGFDLHDSDKLTDALRKSYKKIQRRLGEGPAAGKIQLHYDKQFFDPSIFLK